MSHARRPWSKRKPHCANVGYVASLKCRLGGWIVVYDRERKDSCGWCMGTGQVQGLAPGTHAPCTPCDGRGKLSFDCDADHRWVVMHEPSGRHVACVSERVARHAMKGVARAHTADAAREHADILPEASA